MDFYKMSTAIWVFPFESSTKLEKISAGDFPLKKEQSKDKMRRSRKAFNTLPWKRENSLCDRSMGGASCGLVDGRGGRYHRAGGDQSARGGCRVQGCGVRRVGQCVARSGPGRPWDHAGYYDVSGRGGRGPRGHARATNPAGTPAWSVSVYVRVLCLKCSDVSLG